MQQESPQPIPPQKTPPAPPAEASPVFNAWSLLWLLPLVLVFIALLSFRADDIEFLAGGIAGVNYPYNRLGRFGAVSAWFLLIVMGLAAYPFWLLCCATFVRRVLFPKGLRRADWSYRIALPLFGLSLCFLLGLFPECLSGLTRRLNIYQLPGGLIGMLFSAPPTGFAYRLFNGTGVFIISFVLLCLSGFTIWRADWCRTAPALAEFFHGIRRKWRGFWGRYATDSTADVPPAPSEAAAPADGITPPAANYPQSPAGTYSQPQNCNATAPAVPPAPAVTNDTYAAAAGFRTRRGDASIAAARAAEAAFNPQSDAMAAVRPQPPLSAPATPLHQPELPTMAVTSAPAPAPAPSSAPVRSPAPSPVTPPVLDDLSAAVATGYMLPRAGELYVQSTSNNQAASVEELESNRRIIQDTLDEFNIDAEVRNAIPGPQITLFEITTGSGVLVNRIAALQNNLSMKLRSKSPVRMLLPIPGQDCSGIEVPNKVRLTVTAHELFASKEWTTTTKLIPVILGKNITGETIVIDLAKAPHLIVAGSTGSGKSVCVNLMIQSMLLHFRPDELKLIMFDPKFLEFQPYARLPHLLSPIINDPAKVGVVLRWACEEMDHRYQLISAAGVKQLSEYNSRRINPEQVDSEGNPLPERLPFIVIIIDELADIMAQNGKEVELSLSRLAAKSRAAGIHLIVATQRPDSKVITGTIKNNFPWRVALKVTGAINSRVVIDTNGAESLLGYGDMLFLGSTTDPQRIQGGWVTNDEIAAVVSSCCDQQEQHFDEGIIRALEAHDNEESLTGSADLDGGSDGGSDDLVQRALNVIKMTKRPTISIIQRHLSIGYNKAASLMDQLEEEGYVGPAKISGMRDIYWDKFPGYDSME